MPAAPQSITQTGITERIGKFFVETPAIPSGLGGELSLANQVGFVLSTLLLLVGMIFLIITVYSGITWMMAAGNEEKIEKSQVRIRRAAIGLIIVVGAWIITNFVLRAAFGPTRVRGGAVQVQIR